MLKSSVQEFYLKLKLWVVNHGQGANEVGLSMGLDKKADWLTNDEVLRKYTRGKLPRNFVKTDF